MPQTFNAAVLTAQNEPLKLLRLEIPPTLSVGQVLVKVCYSGICGSQLGEISGVKGPDKYLPHCLGHEGSGIVAACGPGVKKVRPGDHVVMHWRKGTGIECEPPKYWCDETQSEIGGGWVTTFQEYSVVSENRLIKIPDDIDMDVAALLGCAVTTGLGLVTNEVQLKPGQSIIVIGCGGVGLNVIQGAALVSAYPISGIDIVENKLRQARLFGATHAYISNIAELDDIPGSWVIPSNADVVVDTTGRQDIIEAAWKLVAPTGVLCLVAQLVYDKKISINTLPMHTGKRLIGSDGGGTNPSIDIPRYIRLLEADKLKLRPLITHTSTLPAINTFLDEIRAGRVGRGIIRFTS